MIYYGSCLAFGAFSVILNQIGNKHIYSAMHVYLTFFLCMKLNNSMRHINLLISWSKIATFLNRMICSDTDLSVINCDKFSVVKNRKNMPEDFLIHDQVWSQCYFPVNFFKDPISEDDGHLIEVPSLGTSRIY